MNARHQRSKDTSQIHSRHRASSNIIHRGVPYSIDVRYKPEMLHHPRCSPSACYRAQRIASSFNIAIYYVRCTYIYSIYMKEHFHLAHTHSFSISIYNTYMHCIYATCCVCTVYIWPQRSYQEKCAPVVFPPKSHEFKTKYTTN